MSTFGTKNMKYPKLYILEQGSAPGGRVNGGLKPSERYKEAYSISGFTDSNTEGNDMYVTRSIYRYYPEEQEKYTVVNNLVSTGTEHWVATRCVICGAGRAAFHIFRLNKTGMLTESQCYMSSSGSQYEGDLALRPVITVPVQLLDFSVGDGSKEKPWGMK